MENNKPPQYYYSLVDYGPTMRLSIPKPINLTTISREAEQPPTHSMPDYYEYHFVWYEEKHAFEQGVSAEDRKRGIQSAYQFAPAWVYSLVGKA
jgi:hypothetical protein